LEDDMNSTATAISDKGMRPATRRARRRRLARSLTTAVGLLVLGGAVGAAPASAAPGDLAGTWTSVDLDGSNQTLEVKGAGSPVYALFLTDDLASSACGGLPATAVGPAVVDDNGLFMFATLVCRPGGNPIPGTRVELTFEYDAATDTLTDFSGVVWARAG
jgi:hypothetical protein